MEKRDADMERLDETQEGLEELKGQAQEYAEDAAREGKRKLHKLQHDIQAKSEEVMKEITPVLEKYKDSGKCLVHKVEAKIVEKPLHSIMVAFGIGLIIGKLCDRGRR